MSRKRGVQLLNYGGEDLSQEDLKIGTHVYFVDIMDGDVLSNTLTSVGCAALQYSTTVSHISV